RSSNPEGREVQAARSPGPDGRSVEETLLGEIGALNAGLAPGRLGPVGAVVAPAPPSPELPELPLTSMNGLFLAPGIGAQGYRPQDVADTFAACPDRGRPAGARRLLA